MGYAILKIGNQYNDQKRVVLLMAAADDAADLPTDVPVGSFAYREDLSAKYLFGVSGAWIDVTAELSGTLPGGTVE